MPKKKSKPGQIHLRIIEVMKRFPGGITGGQIRQELEKEGLRSDEQTHLDRRKRDLKKWFLIATSSKTQIVNGKKRKVTTYKYVSDREHILDEGGVNQKLRAEVIHAAHGRCQMCGRTIEKQGIVLVVDHKTPRDWGGANDRSNLWAICKECNAGKKAYFSSINVDSEVMKNAMSHESVHVRIGELLKAIGVNNPVPASVLEIVAGQDDWKKRLRELRYPVIGWDIETKLYKDSMGRKRADYVLKAYKPWPENPSKVIREFERQRQILNAAETD
jgi:5-methylcytosine-specific restriction endonuclease McrA